MNSWLATASGLSVIFKYSLEISVGETGCALILVPSAPICPMLVVMLVGRDDCISGCCELDDEVGRVLKTVVRPYIRRRMNASPNAIRTIRVFTAYLFW
jgi:hypothetical protein